MKTTSLIYMILVIFTYNGVTQNFKHQIVKDFNKNIGVDNYYTTTDNYENIYVSGFFMDTIFIHDYMLHTRGLLDIFIAKFNKEGSLLWIKQAGGYGMDLCKTIYTDIYNNVYISGAFRGQAHFEDTVLYSQKTYHYFTAKYSNNGDLVWVRTNN